MDLFTWLMKYYVNRWIWLRRQFQLSSRSLNKYVQLAYEWVKFGDAWTEVMMVKVYYLWRGGFCQERRKERGNRKQEKKEKIREEKQLDSLKKISHPTSRYFDHFQFGFRSLPSSQQNILMQKFPFPVFPDKMYNRNFRSPNSRLKHIGKPGNQMTEYSKRLSFLIL